jgi:YggT family protein
MNNPPYRPVFGNFYPVEYPGLSRQQQSLRRMINLIYLALDIVVLLLLVRMFLEFFVANPFSSFAISVSNLTNPLVAPFRNIFPTIVVKSMSFHYFDTAALVAIVAYAIFAWIVIRLVGIGTEE